MFHVRDVQIIQDPARIISEASSIKTMEAISNERKFKAVRYDRLKKAVTKGMIRPFDWAVADLNGRKIRINGQHSSQLLSNLADEGSLPNKLFVVKTTYACEEEKDVADLWATYDAKDSARTFQEIGDAFGGTDEHTKHIPSNIRNMMISAYGLDVFGFGYGKGSSANDRAAILLDNAEEASYIYENFLRPSQGTHLRKGAVVCAIIKTTRRNTPDAEKFWLEVRDASNPDTNAPTRVLERFLRSARIVAGNGRTLGGNATKGTNPREVLVKCSHAWNAFKRNASTDLKYYSKAPIPELD